MNRLQLHPTATLRGAAAVALAGLLLLGGCAAGLQSVRVELPPYVAQPDARGAPPTARGTLQIDAVRDARRDAVGSLIGERTTIGAVSMGKIDLEPMPTVMMTALLRAEFARMGFVAGEGAPAWRIAGRLAKFEVATPATALYWDIVGSVELELEATAPGGATHAARYEARCTDRTYAWPSEALIGGVVSACLKDIGARLRGDQALAAFLGAR